MGSTVDAWHAARGGDLAARDRLIRMHMPLARSLAAQYRHVREPLEDLVQVANLGLVKAVDRYDADRGIAFTSYAVPTILGELKRHFRDRTWSIHLSRRMQEAIARVESISEDQRQRLGRWPTVREVAAVCDLTVEEVTEALLAAGASRLASLDAPILREDADDDALGDHLGSEDTGLGRVEDVVWLEQVSSDLTPRQREVLRLRFEEDLAQREIAARVGVSQMHISRILRETLERLAESA